MRIVVDDVAVKKDSGGVYSILQDLYSSAKRDKLNQWIFILGESLFKECENIKIVKRHDLQSNYFKRVLFDFFYGAKFINKFEPDVVISMQNTAISGLKCKQYVYIHTPLPFEKKLKFSFLRREERNLAFYQKIVGWFIKASLKMNKNIIPITQTEWLSHQLVQQKIFFSKSIILPPVTNEITKSSSLDKTDYKKSFLFPSTPMMYKRHDVVVNAFLDSKLSDDYKMILTITPADYERMFHAKVNNKNIFFVDRQPRSWVLNAFHNGATLIFPSDMETYGLPIIEAKSCDTNIILHDLPVLREALGNYSKVAFFNDENSLKTLFNSLHSGINIYKSTTFESHFTVTNANKYNYGFSEFIRNELK